MKHMLTGMLVVSLCVANNLNAMEFYQLLEKRVMGLGDSIERVGNVPLVDRLTNLLPFAMVAACFKECPGQTMLVLTGLFIYVLSQNESIRSRLRKYNLLESYRSVKNKPQFDDTLFVFEGESEDDAQEEEDTEDELLSAIFDDMGNKINARPRTPKFL